MHDLIDSIDPFELDREIVREGGLVEFVRMAWHLVEPAVRLSWNWHIDLVCAHLEAVSAGEIKRLLINIPPGCMKSLLVSVFWPLWEWTQRRSTAWMHASFDGSLTIKQANQVQSVIESKWFRERWGDLAAHTSDEVVQYGELLEISYDLALTKAASEFSIQGGGYRFSTSVSGKGTGRHVDIQVVDDPIKPKDTKGATRASAAKLKETNSWWSETMSSRHKDPKTFRRVIVMQRLHEMDLSGTVIKGGGYVHVCLPMEYEPKDRCDTPWGSDPRTEPGELLWEDRFDAHWCAEQKSSLGMGAVVYAAQCQQRPAPAGGTIFKLASKKHWKPGQLPKFSHLIQSWDCTFKNLETSDFVAGGIWGKAGADFYMLDGHMARLTLTETAKAIIAWTKKWRMARGKIIEDAANGPGVVAVLERKVSGLILVKPEGGKEARANACEPYWTGGNVWLPPLTAENKEWLEPMIHQVEFFPFAANDDMVDQMTQAILYLDDKDTTAYTEGVAALKEWM